MHSDWNMPRASCAMARWPRCDLALVELWSRDRLTFACMAIERVERRRTRKAVLLDEAERTSVFSIPAKRQAWGWYVRCARSEGCVARWSRSRSAAGRPSGPCVPAGPSHEWRCTINDAPLFPRRQAGFSSSSSPRKAQCPSLSLMPRPAWVPCGEGEGTGRSSRGSRACACTRQPCSPSPRGWSRREARTARAGKEDGRRARGRACMCM